MDKEKAKKTSKILLFNNVIDWVKFDPSIPMRINSVLSPKGGKDARISLGLDSGNIIDFSQGTGVVNLSNKKEIIKKHIHLQKPLRLASDTRARHEKSDKKV